METNDFASQGRRVTFQWEVAEMLFGKRNDLKSFEIDLGSARFDTASGYLFDHNGQELELRHQSREVLGYLAKKPNQTPTIPCCIR